MEDKSFIREKLSKPSEVELKANSNNYGYSYYIILSSNKGNKYDIRVAEKEFVIHRAAQRGIAGEYETVSVRARIK